MSPQEGNRNRSLDFWKVPVSIDLMGAKLNVHFTETINNSSSVNIPATTMNSFRFLQSRLSTPLFSRR